jgi:hypothetical protein
VFGLLLDSLHWIAGEFDLSHRTFTNHCFGEPLELSLGFSELISAKISFRETTGLARKLKVSFILERLNNLSEYSQLLK